MSDKVTVTFEAEPGKTYKVAVPLGEKLAEASAPVDGEQSNPTVTNTNQGGNPDHDTDDG